MNKLYSAYLGCECFNKENSFFNAKMFHESTLKKVPTIRCFSVFTSVWIWQKRTVNVNFEADVCVVLWLPLMSQRTKETGVTAGIFVSILNAQVKCMNEQAVLRFLKKVDIFHERYVVYANNLLTLVINASTFVLVNGL